MGAPGPTGQAGPEGATGATGPAGGSDFNPCYPIQFNVTYKAEDDGFVFGYVGSKAGLFAATGLINDRVVMKIVQPGDPTISLQSAFCFPVSRSEQYEVKVLDNFPNASAVFWRPIGRQAQAPNPLDDAQRTPRPRQEELIQHTPPEGTP